MYEVPLPKTEFDSVMCGAKQHHILPGLKFEVKDILLLKEIGTDDNSFTGREAQAEITYITSEKNHCALSPNALRKNFTIASFQLVKT